MTTKHMSIESVNQVNFVKVRKAKNNSTSIADLLTTYTFSINQIQTLKSGILIPQTCFPIAENIRYNKQLNNYVQEHRFY